MRASRISTHAGYLAVLPFACFARIDTGVVGRQTGLATSTPANFSPFAGPPFFPYQTFVTEPDFHPPFLEIEKQPGATDGLLVFAPLPIIPPYPDRFLGGLIMDQQGHPIWHSAPLALGSSALGQIEVQQLNGKNVLTYWTGGTGGNLIDAHGFGKITILDDSYRQIGSVTLNDGTFKSGDSLKNAPQPSYVDIHESIITSRNTIIVTAYNSTPYDLTAVGGPKNGWILDSLIYEIDLNTNETLFRWSSIEHVDELPLSGSHLLNANGSIIGGNNATHPWDYCLTNSVNPLDGGYLLSVRHFWSVIALDAKGNVTWILNGETGGDFRQLNTNGTAPPTFNWQHDVRPVNGTAGRNLTIDIFNNNNAALGNGSAPSTGLILHLDFEQRTVETVAALQDPEDPIYTDSQGTFRRLPNTTDHKFMAYGQIPKFKEYDAQNNVVMRARFGLDNQISSYRSYLVSNWSATPYYPPKLAATKAADGATVLSMSWNGATPDVYDTWIVYETTGEGQNATGTPQQVRRTGYETNATLAVGTTSVVAAAVRNGGVEAGRSDALVTG